MIIYSQYCNWLTPCSSSIGVTGGRQAALPTESNQILEYSYLLYSEKTYSDALLSLLPAPTTCRYTVDGPWSSRFFPRFSLVFTRRSGSLCLAFFIPGLISGLLLLLLIEAIVRTHWKTVRRERQSQRARAGGAAAERDPHLTNRNVKDFSPRRTVFIINTSPSN